MNILKGKRLCKLLSGLFANRGNELNEKQTTVVVDKTDISLIAKEETDRKTYRHHNKDLLNKLQLTACLFVSRSLVSSDSQKTEISTDSTISVQSGKLYPPKLPG